MRSSRSVIATCLQEYSWIAADENSIHFAWTEYEVALDNHIPSFLRYPFAGSEYFECSVAVAARRLVAAQRHVLSVVVNRG